MWMASLKVGSDKVSMISVRNTILRYMNGVVISLSLWDVSRREENNSGAML